MTKLEKVLREIVKEAKDQGIDLTLKQAKEALRQERRQRDQRYKEKHGMTRQQAYIQKLQEKANNGDMEAQGKLNRIQERKRKASKEWKKRNPDKVLKHTLKAIVKKHTYVQQNLFAYTDKDPLEEGQKVT